MGNEEDRADLADKYPGCSVADREAVLDHAIAPRKAGRTFSDADANITADSGIVSYVFTTHRIIRTYVRTYVPSSFAVVYKATGHL